MKKQKYNFNKQSYKLYEANKQDYFSCIPQLVKYQECKNQKNDWMLEERNERVINIGDLAIPRFQKYQIIIMTDNQNGQQNLVDKYDINKAAHPCLVTWDIFFKGFPIAAYLLAFLFPNQEIVFRLTIISIMSSIEFWFTKNVLGRVLVGLRWSRHVDEDGKEELIYETKRDESTNNSLDSKFFWGFLIISFIVWGILLFLNLFSLSNLMIILIPFVLTVINLYCFYKCSKEQQLKVNKFIQNQKQNAQNEAVNYGINNYDKFNQF